MIFQKHIHHRASRHHHNIPIHHRASRRILLKGIIKVRTLHHLQLKKRGINGSNSTFHNYSSNCGSKWILCVHTWACTHTYIYIYIHTCIMCIWFFCSFFLHSWRCCCVYSCCKRLYCWRCCLDCCCECCSSIWFWWAWFIITQITSLGILVGNWPNLFGIHLCNILSFSCNVTFNYFN